MRQDGSSNPRTKTGDPYLDLLGAVMEEGKISPDYFRMPCGRKWATSIGLSANYLFHKAVKFTPRHNERYTPLSFCFYFNNKGIKTTITRCKLQW